MQAVDAAIDLIRWVSKYPVDTKTLAVVDADPLYRGRLGAAIERLGVSVRGYDSLLATDSEALSHAGYVLGLVPLVTPKLVKLLRQRGLSAILVLSDGAKPEAVQAAIDGGLAQHVSKLKATHDVAASIAATMRRAWQPGGCVAWRLDRGARQLLAPDGARIDLSVDELALLNCFPPSAGDVVSRASILGSMQAAHCPASPDPVHAALLRLQRRADRVTPLSLPFKAWARSGYSFEGRLELALVEPGQAGMSGTMEIK